MYLPSAEFRESSTMDPARFDQLQTDRPKYYGARERKRRKHIDDMLRRRFVVPFGIPDGQPDTTDPDPSLVPELVKDWLVALLTLDCYKAMGWNPVSEQDGLIISEAAAALAAIESAADPNIKPPVELPIRSDKGGTSGAVRGGPVRLGYVTMWGFFDAQARRRDNSGWE